jgi:hypothetical protein
MVGGVLAGFLGMMLGVGVMAVGDMGVVMSLLVIAGGVMFGGGAMMFRGVFVVFGGLQVVLFAFFRHLDELAF